MASTVELRLGALNIDKLGDGKKELQEEKIFYSNELLTSLSLKYFEQPMKIVFADERIRIVLHHTNSDNKIIKLRLVE